MSDQISALQRQISALRAQKRQFLEHFKNYGTLADKARLIHEGIWKCPDFDDLGIVKNYGWENKFSYSPSRAVINQAHSVQVWRDIESDDPMLIQRAIALWGIEAVCEEFQHYDFQGAHKREPIFELIDGQYEIVGWGNA